MDRIARPGTGTIASYLLKHEFGAETLQKIARALTNPVTEVFTIDRLPKLKAAKYLIEIGFKPGVTDNVAHTVKETIIDLLHLDNEVDLEVFSSKIYLISGNLSLQEVKKSALALYNPLIETAFVTSTKNLENLPAVLPEVHLPKHTSVIKVPLNISDEELTKIGIEGIKEEQMYDPRERRRGPLALDLVSMKAIQAHFANLRRDPTDIELESLAQTWSEHCKHTIFANPIDDIKEGLYKTYIKGATNLIRKQKGKDDFCVSVFKDNAGGIIFDKEYLVTHKMETHNSPSALDPYGGAITGIVGVNRDTIGFGLGAKPVANTYGFC